MGEDNSRVAGDERRKRESIENREDNFQARKKILSWIMMKDL